MIDLGNLQQMISDGMRAFQDQPRGGRMCWAIDQTSVTQSLQALHQIRGSNGPIAGSSRRGDLIDRGSYARRIGNSAVVPVIGPLMARRSGRFFSYDELAEDILMLEDMNDISSIILDIESPGGMVAGIEVAEAAIFQARKSKPVVAHINGIGASAAYYVASAAEKITASPTGLVGSIGALISYLEIEGIFTRLGARKIEAIAKDSPNKRLDPDSEEGKAEMQAIVDDAGEMFLEALSRNRGVSREQLLENENGYGQGLVFPAREGVRRGMVDEILSLEELAAQMAVRHAEQTQLADPAAASNLEKVEMTGKPKIGTDAAKAGSALPMTAEQLKQDHPDLVAAIEKDATDNAHSVATKAERDRIAGIEAQALPGHEDLIAKLKADGAVTPADAAMQVIAAEKALGADRQKIYDKLDKAAEGVESTASAMGQGATGDKKYPATPEGWKQEWEETEALQKEFVSADSYVALKQHEAKK